MNSFYFGLLSVNVRGINNARKRRKQFTWLHKQTANIVISTGNIKLLPS